MTEKTRKKVIVSKIWPALVGVAILIGLAVDVMIGMPTLRCVISGKSCEISFNGPSVNDEIRLNLLRAATQLRELGNTGSIDFESKRFMAGPDKVFVSIAFGDQTPTPIDILDTTAARDVEIFRLTSADLYVVSYPHRRRGSMMSYRLKFYRLQKGIDTAIVGFDCRSNRAPQIEIVNPRFNQTLREFSFDFLSNCTEVTDPKHGEIYFGDSELAKSRVRLMFDSEFIPMGMRTDNGQRDLDLWLDEQKIEREQEKICVEQLIEQHFSKLANHGGWLGKCSEIVDPPEDQRISTIRGHLIHAPNNFSAANVAVEKVYFSCLFSHEFNYEISSDFEVLFLVCPRTVLTKTNFSHTLVEYEYDIDLRVMDGLDRPVEISVYCECAAVRLRAFEADGKSITFDLGADADELIVNGTPMKLGKLPSRHSTGEPHNWGRWKIELTDGGLVRTFEKLEN